MIKDDIFFCEIFAVFLKMWLNKKSDVKSLIAKAVYINFCVYGNKVHIKHLLFFFIKSIKNNWYSSGNVD